jgi:hypothetical protein
MQHIIQIRLSRILKITSEVNSAKIGTLFLSVQVKNVNLGKGPCLAGVKVHRPCLIISDVSTAVNLLRLLYIVAERQQQLQANCLIYASRFNVLDVQNQNIIASYQQEICLVPSNNFILFCLLKGRAFICNIMSPVAYSAYSFPVTKRPREAFKISFAASFCSMHHLFFFKFKLARTCSSEPRACCCGLMCADVMHYHILNR